MHNANYINKHLADCLLSDTKLQKNAKKHQKKIDKTQKTKYNISQLAVANPY